MTNLFHHTPTLLMQQAPHATSTISHTDARSTLGRKQAMRNLRLAARPNPTLRSDHPLRHHSSSSIPEDAMLTTGTHGPADSYASQERDTLSATASSPVLHHSTSPFADDGSDGEYGAQLRNERTSAELTQQLHEILDLYADLPSSDDVDSAADRDGNDSISSSTTLVDNDYDHHRRNGDANEGGDSQVPIFQAVNWNSPSRRRTSTGTNPIDPLDVPSVIQEPLTVRARTAQPSDVRSVTVYLAPQDRLVNIPLAAAGVQPPTNPAPAHRKYHQARSHPNRRYGVVAGHLLQPPPPDAKQDQNQQPPQPIYHGTITYNNVFALERTPDGKRSVYSLTKTTDGIGLGISLASPAPLDDTASTQTADETAASSAQNQQKLRVYAAVMEGFGSEEETSAQSQPIAPASERGRFRRAWGRAKKLWVKPALSCARRSVVRMMRA